MIHNLIDALPYAAVGIGLIVLGAYVVDLLTPGRLVEHIFPRERVVTGASGAELVRSYETGSYSAALVLTAAMLGQGAIAFTTIWTNASAGLASALGWTVSFGLLGIAIQAVGFWVLDLLTPGKLGEVVCVQGRVQPPALVAAGTQLVIAAIVVASIA